MTILKTSISVFMASGRKDTVSEMELVRRILNEIERRKWAVRTGKVKK